MSKLWLTSLLVVSLALVLLGIARYFGIGRFNKQYLERGILDGLQKIPEAKQFDELFGTENVDHFVSYSGPNVPTDWNSEVYFGGRYRLTMQVEVGMSYHFDKVLRVTGVPKFYFVEYASIKDRGGGQFEGVPDQNPDVPYPFDLATWKRIYESNGNFTELNQSIDVNRPSIPRFGQFVAAARLHRLTVTR